MIEIVCFSCGHKIQFSDAISRKDECPKCRSDVRVCKNCEHHDPKVYNECRETQADAIRERDRSNWCDYFTPRKSGVSHEDQGALLKLAAEALFKKS